MILHIGKGKTVREKGLIGIFDLDRVTTRAGGRAFLARASKEGRVVSATTDIPRSFLLYQEEGEAESRIILSHISSLSLSRRAAAGYADLGNEE